MIFARLPSFCGALIPVTCGAFDWVTGMGGIPWALGPELAGASGGVVAVHAAVMAASATTATRNRRRPGRLVFMLSPAKEIWPKDSSLTERHRQPQWPDGHNRPAYALTSTSSRIAGSSATNSVTVCSYHATKTM
ncbi:hypothetical protein Rhe02_12960 [Rhizocola hellebori]|uniref:Uncharacterized protein n=1 Tax=Rhizocola hellebori TaxID=1392758 RepID=A0A8J3Q4E2_9ACTN|nr:hypothetical protein Rhe02_12960 [Rhizocola hellebori]